MYQELEQVLAPDVGGTAIEAVAIDRQEGVDVDTLLLVGDDLGVVNTTAVLADGFRLLESHLNVIRH